MEQKRLKIFAERFAELRGEQTQGEFADFLGISRPTVGFYENGSRLPDALILRQIAEKCEVSADWLLGLSDVPTKQRETENEELYRTLQSSLGELDKYDFRRANRVLVYILEGLKRLLPWPNIYTRYESAVIHVALAISSAAQCVDTISRYDAEGQSQEVRGDIMQAVDKIFNGATSTAYQTLGHFFVATREDIRESILPDGDVGGVDRRFANEADELEVFIKRLSQEPPAGNQ